VVVDGVGVPGFVLVYLGDPEVSDAVEVAVPVLVVLQVLFVYLEIRTAAGVLDRQPGPFGPRCSISAA
jgi:hypothetical protein